MILEIHKSILLIVLLTGKQDVLILVPPGNDDSLCFQLPGVMQDNRITVVFCPLLERMKEQVDHLAKHRIRAESINSEISAEGRLSNTKVISKLCYDLKRHFIIERERILNDLKSETPNTKFLYITPNLAANEFFKSIIQSLHRYDKLAYFVVEEGE